MLQLHLVVLTLMPKALQVSATKYPSGCLHQTKLGLFIESNWIVTKSFAENKGRNIDKTNNNKNECITESSKQDQRARESMCVRACVHVRTGERMNDSLQGIKQTTLQRCLWNGIFMDRQVQKK